MGSVRRLQCLGGPLAGGPPHVRDHLSRLVDTCAGVSAKRQGMRPTFDRSRDVVIDRDKQVVTIFERWHVRGAWINRVSRHRETRFPVRGGRGPARMPS